MEIQQLRHLLAAAQHGCLIKAAGASNITQSGISRSIGALEARLGVPLLVRKAKGVELTPYGETVVRRAKVIVNQVSRSLDEVRSLKSGLTGAVNIGITQNYGLYLMPALLAQLHAKRPQMCFDVVTGGFLELLERVTTGTVDLAFGLLGTFETTDELVVERLREHHSRTFARVQNPLASAKHITAEDLANAPWATLRGEGFQRNFMSFFDRSGQRPPLQVVKTDSIELIRSFVLNSDALTVLPPDVFKDEIDAGAVAILDCEAPAEITQLGLMFRAGGFISPQVELVAEQIRKMVARASNVAKTAARR